MGTAAGVVTALSDTVGARGPLHLALHCPFVPKEALQWESPTKKYHNNEFQYTRAIKCRIFGGQSSVTCKRVPRSFTSPTFTSARALLPPVSPVRDSDFHRDVLTISYS